MLNIEVKPLTQTNGLKNITVVDYNVDEATVTVANNKLVLSKEAVKALGGVAGDRITINYWTVDSETTFPVIGKSECFGDSTGGNRLTKSNTVSFRGVQRDILLEYGSFFKLVRFNNYFKMERVDVISENDLLEEEERDLANLI